MIPYTLISAFLLQACFSGQVDMELSVRQVPEELHIQENTSTNLSCFFRGNFNNTGELSVEWLKNGTSIQYERYNLTDHESSSTLYLNLVRRNQSGKYVCAVTSLIPILFTVDGSGTILVVEEITRYNEEMPAVPATPLSLILLPLATILLGMVGVAYCSRKGLISRNTRITSNRVENFTSPVANESDVQYSALNISSTAYGGGRREISQPENYGEPGFGKKNMGLKNKKTFENETFVVYSAIRRPSLLS